MVETAEEAAAIVRACRYPPGGRRGYSAPTVRASGYGAAADYAKRASEELLICVQIESDRAIANAGAIAAVDGVDLVFIGVADLSGSLDLLERSGETAVSEQIAQGEAAVRAAGKPLGTVPRPGHGLVDLAGEGYAFVAGLSDAALIRAGMAADLATFRAGVSDGKSPG
jgi:4-hydroxy-2-oxoheptanedioate aldolase